MEQQAALVATLYDRMTEVVYAEPINRYELACKHVCAVRER